MKINVAVLTRDDYLYKKIELATLSYALCERIAAGESLAKYDFVIADVDGMIAPAGAIRASRREVCDLAIPFTFDELHNALSGRRQAPLQLDKAERTAYLYGEKIRLTEVEFSLLNTLFEAADFVSREELLSRVWGDDATDGIINVYIHYLREKLEVRGEKIIISSRKMGYRIDEKYLKEAEYATAD